jgi:phage recombination protein Bet
MTALALRDDQTFWDENQLAVLHANGIDGGVTEAELQVFLHECQRRQLDPFTRQIYLIGRWDKRQKRTVYRSQTSIDGFRLIARRAADKAGIDYGYEGTIWFDNDGGQHEIWLDSKPPAGVKVVVVRNGQPFDAVARFSEYVQTDRDDRPIGLWVSMPANQIAKCCEALALRKAFPEDLGGLYTEEEMAQADNPQRVQATVEVVKDERPRANGHTPAAAAPADPEWDAQVARISGFATEDDGRRLWAEVVARRKEGKITPGEDKRLKDLIKARWAELKDQADAEPVDGTIVAGLDPADPWALRIGEITDEDGAAELTEEVMRELAAGHIDDDKAAAVHAAVAARVAAFDGQGALV